jgi:hypothetical protein
VALAEKNSNERTDNGGSGAPLVLTWCGQRRPEMRISRKYKVEDWQSLDFTSEADWQKAITIFEDRLETRYHLEHIRALLLRSTSGFVVLTLTVP